jgi:rhamnulokinase
LTTTRHAAVDLGASSGRVVVAEVGDGQIRLAEAARFPNAPVRLPSGLHWDVLSLYRQALDGLGASHRRYGDLTSIGIDTWAVDYGLLDRTGALLGNPYHYRDDRTNGMAQRNCGPLAPANMYRANGLQVLPFNTCYQLAAAAGTPQLSAARSLLLIPDLIGNWLTGHLVAEATNASTTGLMDVRTRRWSPEICDAIGLDMALLPPVRPPGEVVNTLLRSAREATGIGTSTVVTLVGSHDTASAVVAVPMDPACSAYISLGTWGLVGVELEHPIVSDESRAANFTNELGVDDRVRFLRNVMGLWLLQESLRVWAAAGLSTDLRRLLEAAADLPTGGPVIDVDDPRFLLPGDMPGRIIAAAARSGEPPGDQVAIVRCVVDSLASAFARALRDAVRLSGRDVQTVHIVGGGSQNALLCQLTADACGMPVVAGPVEATALGNVLVQARAAQTLTGGVDALRHLVRRTQVLRRFEPRVLAA